MKLMPTLSAIGWTSNTTEKLDFTLSHFFEAERDQSYLYSQDIADVSSIIYGHGQDVNSILTDLKVSLEKYLRSVFDYAEVRAININKEKEDMTGKVTIELSVYVRDDSNSATIDKLYYYSLSRFNEVLNYYNGENI